jgi:uncharacterized RDD family membrane protein YckC
MQNSYISSAMGPKYIQEPDNKVLVRRYIALLIDSFVIAVLTWLATRAFGTAQPGNSTAIPGGLIDAGGIGYGVSNFMGGTASWIVKLPVLWTAVLVFIYFVLQETFFGATLGKAMMGLRVIYQRADNSYTTLPLIAAIVRNLIRFLDVLPAGYLVGWITALISPRRQRLGDLAAHTFVVRRESVPYLGRSREQIKQGFLVVACVLLAFTITCQAFSYFGRPPLVIQNAATTDNLFPNEQIIRYTLGEKTWGHNNQGQQTVTYPISFVSKDLSNMPHEKLHSCQGSVTLVWSDLDWTRGSSNDTCPNP